MPRNPFWTGTRANIARIAISSDNTSSVTFAASDSTLYENQGGTSGTLSSFDVIDFVPIYLSTGASYTMVATGSFSMDIEIFDSSGYLLISTDGDDVGLFDPYPTDSIVGFTPDSSGLHYVSVFYANGDFTGNWGVFVAEDIGGDFQNTNGATTPIPTNTATSAFDVTSGTASDDSMFGASGADELWGANGNDTIESGDGSDIIYGNKGLDIIIGGDGNDTLFGGQNGGTPTGSPAAQRDGVETISGGNGDDVLYGNHGTDRLIADGGNDTLFGGQDADTLDGGSGDDKLFGNLGDDVYNGGSGADVFGVAKGNDTINDFGIFEGDQLSTASDRTAIRAFENDTWITFENGTSVKLVGVAFTDITDAHFL